MRNDGARLEGDGFLKEVMPSEQTETGVHKQDGSRAEAGTGELL